MTALDINAIRQRIIAEREGLISSNEALEEENQAEPSDFGVSNHSADDASDVTSRERNLALMSNNQDLLAQIDQALERLDNGTYGTCERCGKQINNERLEALPYATYCITCQAEIEQQNR